MSIRNLDKIFNPRVVAVAGASEKAGSVGAAVFRNLIGSGFSGIVYPVNPKRESIQGVQAFPDFRSLPKVPDLAVICTPAETVPDLVNQCGEVGINGVIILSAGFREIGQSGMAIEARIREAARKYAGMRLIGPNCLGIIAPHRRLNASFAAAIPAPGHVAFISQSGALCTSVLDWALEEGIGFSHFISVGNALDVDFGDLIDYLGQDEHTRSILLYVESISNPRKFMSAVRAFARNKPIVAYKAGRFADSARAAASHTGAMAGEDAVYEAAFRRAGIVRISEIEDIFDCAELIARRKTPKGARLAIMTNAGGPGVMAADDLIGREGNLAELAPETLADLAGILPPFWSHHNPVDLLGDAPPERYRKSLARVLEDPGVDAALVILTPQSMTDPTGTGEAVGSVAAQSVKPVLASWMGGGSVRDGVRKLNGAGVATYNTPEQAIRAFMYLVQYARNLETLYETPMEVPVKFSLDRHRIKDVFGTVLLEGRELLSEAASKSLLEAYEIPVTRAFPAFSPEEAAALASKIGFPVVLKVFSPQITHKTDVGGILLDLKSEREVTAGFRKILASVREKVPEAAAEGVTVQRMIPPGEGIELLLGAKQDPTFGSVILVGLGGIAAEVHRDQRLELPPLNERLARKMLESLRSWPLLKGYRGKPGVHLDRLIEILIRFSYLVADYPEIREFDINPLWASPEEVIALDARAVVDRKAAARMVKPYAHLAIRPYPEQYVKQVCMKDGTLVTLRPIKPEDEPMWHALLARCSPDTIRSRFRYLFKQTTHEMATRFCFIDYDREMAMVAEAMEEGNRAILGVGRLVADPDHADAEYAVLVADPWQGKGLGILLTEYCEEIARSWEIRRITAETTPGNQRMLATFRHQGFNLEEDKTAEVIRVWKNLE